MIAYSPPPPGQYNIFDPDFLAWLVDRIFYTIIFLFQKIIKSIISWKWRRRRRLVFLDQCEMHIVIYIYLNVYNFRIHKFSGKGSNL